MWDFLLESYECLGNAYKCLFQYHKAILCFKKQILMSWLENNKESELRAYDNIGLQYYYLGNRSKAKYYHKRFLLGKGETEKSDKRRFMMEEYRKKHLLYVKMNSNDMNEQELQFRLKQVISTYHNKIKVSRDSHIEQIDLAEVDYHQMQDVTRNSMISKCDMTFIEGRYVLIRRRRS